MQELEQVSSSLEENKAFFQEKFKNAMDFMLRELELSGTKAEIGRASCRERVCKQV